MTNLSHPDGSDHEVGQLLFVLDRDPDPAVDLLAVFTSGPILDAHNLGKLDVFNFCFEVSAITLFTLMKSKVLVTITMHEALSCHTIRQKSPMVVSVGPWVTM